MYEGNLSRLMTTGSLVTGNAVQERKILVITLTHNSFAEKFCNVTLHQLVSLTFMPDIVKQELGAVFFNTMFTLQGFWKRAFVIFHRNMINPSILISK